MKVSIIVPFHNSEKTLNQCLESLKNQSYENHEIILIDNNSKDSSTKIAQKFANENMKIILTQEEIIGRGSARRKGELISTGEIILMTDSDCVMPTNWIEKMIRPIIDGKADAVQGTEQNINKNFWSDYIQKKSERNDIEKVIHSKEIIGKIDTKSFAIKRNLLEKIGFSSEKYVSGNDTDLSIKLSRVDCSIYIANAIVLHNNPDSLFSFAKKQFYRAYWTARITKDNKEYLKATHFLKNTNQTTWSFIKFFPGLLKTLFLEGAAKFYFDLVEGMSWRLGITYFYFTSYLPAEEKRF